MKKRIITIDIETLPCDESFESKLFWETEEEYRIPHLTEISAESCVSATASKMKRVQ